MRKLRSTELKYFLALSLASPLALADNSGSDNFSSRVLEESLENRILDTRVRLTRPNHQYRTVCKSSSPATSGNQVASIVLALDTPQPGNLRPEITNLRSTQVIQLH